MRQTHAAIERIIRLSADLTRVELATDFGSIMPGQYLLVRPRDAWEPYLRARWELVRVAGGLLSIDHPADALDPSFMPGVTVDVLGPCGKPIPARQGAERFLLIVQDAPLSPLLAFIEAQIENERAVTVVLEGDEAQRYPLGELPPQVEVLHAPGAWGWLEQQETIKWADQIVALAPPHQALQRYGDLWKTITQLRAPRPADFAWGMFRPPVLCGVGACGACLVNGKRGDIHACTDGPALNLATIDF